MNKARAASVCNLRESIAERSLNHIVIRCRKTFGSLDCLIGTALGNVQC